MTSLPDLTHLGMTAEIASELGTEAVPFLLALLADETFPRPDNVVAYLAYLGPQVPSSVAPLVAYAAARRAAATESPDQVGIVMHGTHVAVYILIFFYVKL